ncbi:hypothetical protein RZS08_65925, partial [Arthrospira platensis SPKY1]|nr:hypothetical protein [Arthrospira platensis SPKY1]
MAQLNLGDLLKPLADIAQEGMPAVRVIDGTSIESAQEIIMVEDINGDLTALQNSLRLAGLINDRNLWIGGEGIAMIQLGVKSMEVHLF